MGGFNADKGSATVTISNEDIIMCRLEGRITGQVVRESMRQTQECVRKLRTEGKVPRLLIDVSGITKQTSEARREAKRLTTFGLEKIAVCGGSRTITAVGKYIAQAAGMSGYTKFFRTHMQSVAWLKSRRVSQKSDQGVVARPIISAVIILICVGVLIGWQVDSQLLKAWLPKANSMNPMNAVNFIFLAIVFLLFRKGKLSARRQIIIAVAGVWFILWGSLILLRNALGWDLPVDRILFHSKIAFSNGIAPNTSLDYLLLGGLMLTVLSGMRKMWQRYLFHFLSVILVVTTLGAIFGMSFGLEQLYSGNFVPMALTTAIVFLLFNHMLQTVTIPLPFFARIMDNLNKYIQPVIVLFALLFVVGLAWQQSRQDVARSHDIAVNEVFDRTRASIVDRFDTYTNVLRGYKGFFESSDAVNADEYKSYFTNSQPAGGYPGFTAITFVRAIPGKDEAAFVAEMKNQAKYVPGLTAFRINPKTDNQMLYPLTFAEPHSATTNWGFDLGTSDIRRTTLEKARDTGRPTASGEINLNASLGNAAVKRTGFFMSLPIYKHGTGQATPKTMEERRSQIYGFVNTVFENDKIFGDILKNQVANQDVKVVVTNIADQSVLYTHNPKNETYGPNPLAQGKVIIGDQHWNIAIFGNKNLGVASLTQTLPYLILFGGSALALLAFGFLMSQMRQRDQALKLAHAMTEDLQRERNDAVLAQQKDEAILESIGDAVFAIDSRRRIVLFNPAAEMISGYSRQEALGRPYDKVLKFIYEKDRALNNAFIEKALSGHLAEMKNHTMLIRKDGTETFVSDSAAPIRDTKGRVVGVIVVFRDVSKELTLERAKSEFVSLASHQLRTPLSAINWYSEMLLNGDAGKVNEDQYEYIKEIYQGNQRMIELVDALLDVSRLEVGKLRNDPQHTSMIDLARSLEKEMQTSITTKKITVKSDLDEQISTVYADPKLLRMIIQNLLSNAIKYTPDKGQVTLTMRHATSHEVAGAKLRPGRPYLFVSVADTGYGIPKEQQSKIFGKLFRADNVRKLDVEGTGLGLYIIKEVTKKLGGTIWFESIESVGTTFYVVIPFKTKPS